MWLPKDVYLDNLEFLVYLAPDTGSINNMTKFTPGECFTAARITYQEIDIFEGKKSYSIWSLCKPLVEAQRFLTYYVDCKNRFWQSYSEIIHKKYVTISNRKK